MPVGLKSTAYPWLEKSGTPAPLRLRTVLGADREHVGGTKIYGILSLKKFHI